MRKLLNTLFVTQPNMYLSLEGNNVVMKKEDEVLGRIPLHNLESIVNFGYVGASPALMGYCADNNISIVFLTMYGRFLARVSGMSRGNVHLRKRQYIISEDETESALISRNFIIGKIFNQKWMIEKAKRNHPLRVDEDVINDVSRKLTRVINEVRVCEDLERLRGLEGQAAVYYNTTFNHLIL